MRSAFALALLFLPLVASADSSVREPSRDPDSGFVQVYIPRPLVAYKAMGLAQRSRLNAVYREALARETGNGADKDPAQALALYRQAAAGGHPQAQLALGQAYLSGSLGEKNPVQALAWLRRAAGQDEPVAVYNLAWMNANGVGTERDDKVALALYQRAARAGLPKAQFNLALLYHDSSAQRDLEQSYVWFAVASQQGLAEAKPYLAELEAQLTPDQLARARQQAANATVAQVM